MKGRYASLSEGGVTAVTEGEGVTAVTEGEGVTAVTEGANALLIRQ